MARAKAQDSVTRYNPTSGRMQPVVGAEVRVYENNDLGSPLVATMYDALTAGNVLPWPLTTDANGFWFFFLAAPQQVSLVITYPGMTTRTVHDVQVEIPADEQATDADITAALAGYVTTGALTTALGSYATTAAAILKSLVTTAGDLIYGTGSAAVARLPVGTANQELGVNAGATAPQWFDGARKVLTTAGDMLYATGAATLARLAKGTAWQELVMNAGATAPSWATGVLALAAAAGDTFYATGANALAKLTKGTAFQELTMNSGATAPQWSSGVLATISAAGDLIYGSGANAISRLAKGTAYQMLRMNAGATAPEWAHPPFCKVFHSVDQSIATGSLVDLAMDSESEDSDVNGAMHDNVTNNTRITFKTAGVYDVVVGGMFGASATGQRVTRIVLNGTTVIAYEPRQPLTGVTTAIGVSVQYRFAVNDYITFGVYQDSGGALLITRNSDYSPRFSATWVRG